MPLSKSARMKIEYILSKVITRETRRGSHARVVVQTAEAIFKAITERKKKP